MAGPAGLAAWAVEAVSGAVALAVVALAVAEVALVVVAHRADGK